MPPVPLIPAAYTVSQVPDRMDDARAIDITSPVRTALPFLPLETLSLTANCLPGWAVTHICLLACEFSSLATTQQYLAESSFLYLSLTDQAVSRILAQLGKLHAFNAIIEAHSLRATFAQARSRASVEGCLPSLQLTFADFTLSFTPPVPGPTTAGPPSASRRNTRNQQATPDAPAPEPAAPSPPAS
eukprot:4240750-Pleurochrysis_carterae.AAC.1